MTNPSSLTAQAPSPICRDTAWTRTVPELKPLLHGPVQIETPIVQAALSGYSDWPMRVVARRLGAPYTIAEVMIDRFVLDLKNRKATQKHLRVTDAEHPAGGQLMGSNPAHFPPAAQRLVEAGFDVIDINFGCPVKSAVGGCRGGYHLGQPEIALEIVARVRNAVPDTVPVTVKMRRGIDDSSESEDRFFEIFDGIFEHGAAAVTVHGRTVQQKYNGPSSWDFLRRVKCHAGSRTVIGSGDIFTPQASLDMLSYTGVDGVSVARGAIGNPWFFQQTHRLARGASVTLPSVREQRRVLAMQLELCREIYDDRGSAAVMRKFGIKFAPLHPAHKDVRNAFARGKSLTDWQNVLDRFYV
ncbi:MAG: tRNA-dihydrouridine synthase [Planctomycetaceae bacterium]